MVDLSLVGSAATVPEEQPLQDLVLLERVREAELVLLVVELEQVQQLSRRLDDGERRALAVVDQGRDAPVRVQAQEPLLLLLVGRDVDERRAPRQPVGVGELLEQDLRRLAVWRVLRDEVQALGRGDVLGRLGDVEVVCHCCCFLSVLLFPRGDWKCTMVYLEAGRWILRFDEGGDMLIYIHPLIALMPAATFGNSHLV